MTLVLPSNGWSRKRAQRKALILRRRAKLVAPELLTAECANIPWKKCQRDELSKDEAFLAAQLLQAADIEFLPTRLLLEAATRIAVELDHTAYDCLYLALASERGCRFVTADERFVRKLAEGRRRRFRGRVFSNLSAAGAARTLGKADKLTRPRRWHPPRAAAGA